MWDQTLEKPGCAFSRSLGDYVGKGIGVTAEPEILEWAITAEDKFAVVASDGVFEFITSQSVIDMIAKFTDPIEAAKYVVSEAYRLWLTYDDRTDDITIIIIYFESICPSTINNNSRRPTLDAATAPTSANSVTAHYNNNKNNTTTGIATIARSVSVSRTLTNNNLMDSRPVRKVTNNKIMNNFFY